MAAASTLSKRGGKDGETGGLKSTIEQIFKENRMLMSTTKSCMCSESHFTIGGMNTHEWGKEGCIELCGMILFHIWQMLTNI